VDEGGVKQEKDLRRLEFGKQHEEVMFLEPKVAPHRGFPRVLRLEILDLDDQSLTLLFVPIPQGDHLPIIPVPVVSRAAIVLTYGGRTRERKHVTSIPPRCSCSSPFRLPTLP